MWLIIPQFQKNIVGTLIIFSFYNQVFKYYILQFNQSKF
jgi:hypothetical protein